MMRQARRGFLKMLGAAAAPFVVPASALGAAGRPAPSERIGLGHIGVGGMGSGHLGGMLGRRDCQVLAVCDPFRSKRDRAKERVEKAYARQMADGTYKGCAAYSDFRDLVGRPDIDAMFIASPEHWHVLHSPAAVRSGNFVECVRTRRQPICNVDVGHHTCVVCNLSDIAIRLGRKLRWDPQREIFPGDDEANRMLTRTMRAPWTL